MKKHNVSDPLEAQAVVEIQGTTKKGKPVVRKRATVGDRGIDVLGRPRTL